MQEWNEITGMYQGSIKWPEIRRTLWSDDDDDDVGLTAHRVVL